MITARMKKRKILRFMKGKRRMVNVKDESTDSSEFEYRIGSEKDVEA